MRCPSCRAEVVHGSVFCHKCGQRLDLDGQGFPAPPTTEPPPSPHGEPSELPTDGASAGAPNGPTESPSGEAQRRSATEEFRRAAGQPSALSDESERELWQGGYSPKAMIGPWLLADVVTVALVVAGAIWVRSGWLWLLIIAALVVIWAYLLAVLAYRRLSVAYRLTTQRFVHQSGLLRRVIDRIEVIDMDDVTYEQTIVQRMFNVGTLHIQSSDRTHPELTLHGIEDVGKVASLMDDARRTERMRRGLHIEAV